MDNQLVVKENTDLITFDDDKVALIKRTVAKGATDDELALFLHQAKRTGLDPLAKQIYFQKYNTKNGPQIAIITGIDGYRLSASRSGSYAGNDEPVFEGRIDYAGIKVPAKATVTVWRFVQGQRVPFSASVYWDEYCPGPPKDYQWKKMPHVMLAKCAEAAALRKAFPQDLGGVYTQEEMQQADFMPVDSQIFDAGTGEIIDGDIDESAPIIHDGTITPRDRILQANDPTTLGYVAEIAAITGLYRHNKHALNAMKDYEFPKGVKVEAGQKVSADGALKVFDWLIERKQEAQDEQE